MGRQAIRGVQLNVPLAQFTIHRLNELILAIDAKAVPMMPLMLEKGCTATAPFKKDGGFKSNVVKWIDKENLQDWSNLVEGPFSGISWRPFDMGKTEAIKEYMAKLGWKPDTWSFRDITMHSAIKRPLTAKEQEDTLQRYMEELRKSNLGYLKQHMLGIKKGMSYGEVKQLILKKRKVPTGAKLTEDSLKSFDGGELGLLLKKRLTFAHRRALIAGLVKEVRSDGRIPAEANTIGTPTNRMTHSKVVNIPKAAPHVIFGHECRSLFEAGWCDPNDNPNGLIFRRMVEKKIDGKKKLVEKRFWIPPHRRVFMGYDGAGLELRMLAHFINDPEYTKQVIEGDIHSYNQQLAGLPTRDDAKTFIYAFIYGAGDAKLGSIVGGGKKEGAEMRARFLASCPQLQELIESTKEEAEQGYVVGLDGRRLHMRRDGLGRVMTHKALNTKLQGSGATVMKYAMVLLEAQIKEQGLDALKVIDMHDEGQYDVNPRDIQAVGVLMDNCVREAGEYLQVNCPLASEHLIGFTWADTH